jgi:hypothetical protein
LEVPVDQFSLLGSLAKQLNQEFIQLYYLFLPVFFALAIALDWFKNPSGSPAFVETFKRALVATLLVASFHEISVAILTLSNSVADRISDMSGFDIIYRMAKEKCQSYTLSPMTLVLGFDDMVIAILSFCSYVILYVARYVTVALYHFMWLFLSIMAPILMLFHLFKGTQSIPLNLFKSMIEVASWKIAWAVMSAMITSLSFGNAYAADGNYLTVILMNFIIALAMLGTPMIVKSLIGSGLSSMAESLGMAAVVTMVSAPAKVKAALEISREVLSDTAGFSRQMGSQLIGSSRSHDTPHTNSPPPSAPPSVERHL